MGKDDAKTRASSPEARKASRLLSGLVLTADSALDEFRERRAANPEIQLEHLRHARDILDELHLAIASNDDERWKRVERAWELLRGANGRAAPPPADDVDGDLTLPADDVVHEHAALPFHGGPHPPPPVVSPDQPVDATDRTAEARSPFAPALPFDQGPVGGPPSSRTAVAPQSSRTVVAPQSADSAPVDRHPAAGATIDPTDPDYAPTARLRSDMLAAPGVPPPHPAPPSAAPLPAHLEAFGVEQYAAFCADCTLYPEWLVQVSARHGIPTEAERLALDEHWGGRLAADPALEAVWRWHCANYEEWGRRGKR